MEYLRYERFEIFRSKILPSSAFSDTVPQESAGRVSQEIIGGANIPAIPLISSRVPLPQALGQHAVPVFRISYGNYEIEPSIIPESSIAEGHYDCNSPYRSLSLLCSDCKYQVAVGCFH